ncbi:dTDP-4-dehydrorhamnose reductase [Legionella worsleiensis]|uniref:dTDP-4-dehydrorhamnose reductase n=1 Tax=Legionella worsleiensis TaxID=45076 RepID=A0A0W1A394_9GAMM|nr:dTDP-4-dehydrorhamnose reductase [Legionella worsleiensis]KTD75858.1 dTDP-4-keto-L-rhamnose reductase [Legionella worsleiensis]STY32871.1 dTDP-6-deoxy-L-mannose dehydrogenase RmlD [Legionella worsleiensis]
MKLLIIGAQGQVGSELVKAFAHTGHEIIPLTRRDMDCSAVAKVYSTLVIYQPELIINAAAYTAVDKAEEEPHLAEAVNADFVRELAIFCRRWNVPLIHLSTDYVFDGLKNDSYDELDHTNPKGAYALSKLHGEQAITSVLTQYIILRVSWVFGVTGTNFVKTIVNLAASRDELNIVADQKGRPTAARDIARVIVEIVMKIDGSSFDRWGIYHYAGKGETNWYEFAQVFMDLVKASNKSLKWARLNPISTDQYPTKAKRPKNSVLNTSRIEDLLGIECQAWNNYLPEIIDSIFTKEGTHELSR